MRAPWPGPSAPGSSVSSCTRAPTRTVRTKHWKHCNAWAPCSRRWTTSGRSADGPCEAFCGAPRKLLRKVDTGMSESRSMTTLSDFISGLPKAELHVHHVGSASPRIVAELAARHAGSTPVPADEQALADYFDFRDFAHFIEVYLSVVDLIRDAEDVRMLTYEIGRELGRQQVRYAELTVTPYSSVSRGIPAPAFVEAIEDARTGAF